MKKGLSKKKFKQIDKKFKGKVPKDLIFNYPEKKEDKGNEIMVVLIFLLLAFGCGYIVGVWTWA